MTCRQSKTSKATAEAFAAEQARRQRVAENAERARIVNADVYLPWFALAVACRAERKIELELHDKGFDAYCPRETVWRSHAGKRDAVCRPLLPGYLFVAVDFPRRSFYEVESIFGVSGFLVVGGAPRGIPFHWVDELRQAEAVGKFDKTAPKVIALRQDQPVRVISGPFKGLLGLVVQARTGEDRVRVMLEAFGGAGVVSIDAAKLEVA